jgi:hypothetical protein
MEQYQRFRSVGLFERQRHCHHLSLPGPTRQVLAHLVMTTPELFVAIEAKAESVAFFHLGHR